MNKTITMYELLGLVKDGKLMPKRIKFENYIYIWRDTQKDYFCEQINHSLESIIGEYLFNNLNLEVEILEEEKKIPEKLEPLQKDYITLDDIKFTFSNSEMILVDKINEIIDYLKSKGDE